MVKLYLVYPFVVLFFLVFSPIEKVYSLDKMKLHFKNVKIESSIKRGKKNFNTKRIINFLNSFFSDRGELVNFQLKILLKKHNIIIRKPYEEERESSFFNKKESRVFIHKVVVTFEAKDLVNKKVIAFSKLNISDSKKVEDFVGLKERKKINLELSEGIEKKLGKELRKEILLNLGDFIIPN